MEEPARAIWTTRMSLWRWAAVGLALVIVVLRRDLQAGPVVALAVYIVLTALLLQRYSAWSNSPLVAVLDVVALSLCVLTSGGERGPVYIIYVVAALDIGARLLPRQAVLLALLAAIGYSMAAWGASLLGVAEFDGSLAATRGFLIVAAATSSASLMLMLDSERARAAQGRALSTMMRLAVAAALDIPALLKSVVEQACLAAGAELGLIYLQDADGQITDAASYGLDEREEAGCLDLAAEHVRRTAEQSGRAAPAPAAEERHDALGLLTGVGGPGVSASAPLTADGALRGAIWLARRQNRPFSRAELDLLALMSQHAVLAIHNARLHAIEKKTVSELREAEQVKSEFLSMMSHDLRTPLTAIRASAGLLLDDRTGELNANQQRLVQSIARNSDRLTNLVTDLLDTARLQSGRLVLNCELSDIHPIIRACVSSLRPLLEEKGQTLALSVPKDLPRLIVDRRRIEQVLMNLLSNAHRYTQEGGELRLSVGSDGGMLTVTVGDNGPGVAQTERESIFERFYRGSAGRRAGQPGTGLGLAVAKSLVEMHDGTIGYRPGVDGGSEFYFTLPLDGPR